MNASILLWVLFIRVVFVDAGCQRPDVPENGNYEPKKETYLHGDIITYKCDEGYLRNDNEKRECNTNDMWTARTPFCDAPVKLKDPSASSYEASSNAVRNVMDKNTIKCFRTKNGTKEFVKISLEEPARVEAIRINLRKGSVNITGYVRNKSWRPEKRIKCDLCSRTLERSQWIELLCKDNSEKANEILVEQNAPSKSLEICEVEVYAREDNGCENPPQMIIANGRLVINRQRATLECNTGYKEVRYTRVVCGPDGKFQGNLLQCTDILCDRVKHEHIKGGFWKVLNKANKLSVGTVKELNCEKGYNIQGGPERISCQQNGTWTESSAKCVEKKSRLIMYIIIGSVLGVLILVSCFGILLYLIKKKSKPVVVVVSQGENCYAAQSGSSTGSCNTAHEYATIPYDQHPLPEITPKSTGQVKLSKEYLNPLDGVSPNKTAYSKFAHVPTYMVPQDSFPIEKTSDSFESLKMSPLYNPSSR